MVKEMKQDKRQYQAPETSIVTTSDDLMQSLDGMTGTVRARLYTSWQGAEDEEPLPVYNEDPPEDTKGAKMDYIWHNTIWDDDEEEDE